MKMKGFCLFLVLVLQVSNHVLAQKVGVVLSGGGAAGAAHVGFLKVLEENEIPIDYIAGTSAGAIVASFYAAGYSPDEIRDILGSEEFISMAKGAYEDENIYYFKKDDPNASWINFKLSLTGNVSELIPTNFVDPTPIDFNYVKLLAQAEARANYNFDSLFIPFRCVASDVRNKKQVVFKNGNLTQAIRASSTYPFYIKPIRVDGSLLFDGGIYNNFPMDVIYDDFFPDIILGCNVAGSGDVNPLEDDVLSQLKAMVLNRTDNVTICENGIVVQPDMSDIGTFSFDRTTDAYVQGVIATKGRMEEIKSSVARRTSVETLTLRRKEFKSTFKDLVFKNIHMEGLNRFQTLYIKRSLLGNRSNPDIEFLQKKYFKVFSDEKIKSIYPKSRYNESQEAFDLYLKIQKEKDFRVGIGGNFSSRPVTTGMVNIRYNYLNVVSAVLEGNYYFGSFYNSAMIKARIDVPFGLPFFIEPEFNASKTDFFKTKSFEFENEKPSFFKQFERFGRINLGVPVKNKGKMRIGYSFGRLTDDYYQSKNYTKVDTADENFLYFRSPYLLYERSTLNDRMYANQGTFTSFSVRYVSGDELFLPGSTSISKESEKKIHQWVQTRFFYENYYKRRGILKLGFYGEAFYSTQTLFNNYSASILRARPFKPTTESNVLFLESFRANQFLSFGHRIIFSINSSIDLRFEGFIFQPIQRILPDLENSVTLTSQVFDKRFVGGSANLVIKTPLGPLSFSTNYYHNVPEIALEQTTPLTFFFHFGYVLFNRRALE